MCIHGRRLPGELLVLRYDQIGGTIREQLALYHQQHAIAESVQKLELVRRTLKKTGSPLT